MSELTPLDFVQKTHKIKTRGLNSPRRWRGSLKMIVGVGVDIVEVPRIKDAVLRWKDAFLRRIFTDNEINYSKAKKFAYQHLAARFAAKEAVLKAIGDSSIQRIEWHEVEVFNDEFGKPFIRLSGEAKKIKEDRKISDIIISMSHTRAFAIANAILIKDGRD